MTDQMCATRLAYDRFQHFGLMSDRWIAGAAPLGRCAVAEQALVTQRNRPLQAAITGRHAAPVLHDPGTNTMVGRDRAAILHGVDEILAGRGKRGRVPEYWDGHAAERIADVVLAGA